MIVSPVSGIFVHLLPPGKIPVWTCGVRVRECIRTRSHPTD